MPSAPPPARIALVRTYQPSVTDNLAHPLGIMALDAYLRERGYDDIRLFDMRLEKETPEQLAARLPTDVDVVGLSALTIEMDTVHALTGLIKRRIPGVRVVVGGPYATSSKRSLMRDRNIDAAVIGEGEATFHELLEAYRTGAPLSGVLGLVYRDDGGALHQTAARPFATDLDALPLPSWDRIDMAAYERCDPQDRLAHPKWAAFYTSRGCPYRCTYCHDVFGKRFRARSADRVIEELAWLVEDYGVREVHFFDDIFNFDKRRVVAICNEIVRRGWKLYLQFPNGLRADLLDVETLAAMKAAGTFRVSYAIESASPRIQKQVKKHLKIDKVRTLIEQTDAMGILTHGFFMLGFPGETREEVQATVKWALESKLHTAGFFLVCPFEGSPLGDEYLSPADQAQTRGTDWRFYDNPHALSQVPPEELKWLQRSAYLRFYANPWRARRFVQLLPDKRALWKLSSLFVRVMAGGFKVRGADPKSFDHRPSRVDGTSEPLVFIEDPPPVARAAEPRPPEPSPAPVRASPESTALTGG